MMIPRISARFRKRDGIPYAIEYLSGRQYRCRHCNSVFVREKDLESHIRRVLRSEQQGARRVCQKAPELSTNTEVRVIYTYDIMDKMKRPWLKLKSGEQYDGV